MNLFWIWVLLVVVNTFLDLAIDHTMGSKIEKRFPLKTISDIGAITYTLVFVRLFLK